MKLIYRAFIPDPKFGDHLAYAKYSISWWEWFRPMVIRHRLRKHRERGYATLTAKVRPPPFRALGKMLAADKGEG